MQIGYLKILNNKHEQRRESIGKPGKAFVDHSMQAVRAAAADDEAADTVKPSSPDQGHDHSLDDLTDWQNEDFVYVY
jgi:hypothetical protein